MQSMRAQSRDPAEVAGLGPGYSLREFRDDSF
jgi:hypothetical protein